jgi:hypothetical protein
VYKFNGNALSGPIPAQVDEVTASGDYISSEDNLLDSNDEIAFMTKDLGDQPSDTSALSSFTTWYEIEVIDPLSSSKRGWAYLVRRSSVAVSGDYVDYNAGTMRITTTPYQYNLGFASTHIGLDYLTLPGNSTDILDRTKLRVIRPLFPTVTEEYLLPFSSDLIKDGRVRVILQRSADFELASLTTTYLAYSSMVQSSTEVESSITVSSVRTSADLSSAASGSSFYNANITGGVTINGVPDAVAPTPLSNWAQISHSDGRLIQVIDPTPAGGTPSNYYCDDSTALTTECDGTTRTGDNGSYGDAGILLEGNPNPDFTIESSLFVLPASAGGEQDRIGDQYADYSDNPLIVVAYLEGERNKIFLPLVLKNSQ